MPAKLLKRLQLPSLRTYIGLSVLSLGLAFLHAHRTVMQSSTRLNPGVDHRSGESTEHVAEGLPPELTNVNVDYSSDDHWEKMLSVMKVGTWSWWAVVNIYFCFLIAISRLIQKAVFGEIRFVEQLHLKEKFWNFVFSKFIIIFGVMDGQGVNERVSLIFFFSIMCILHLLIQLSKDRLEYLSYSSDAPRSANAWVLTLLVVTVLLCREVLVEFYTINTIGINIYTFKAAEMLIVLLKCLYVIVRYVIQVQLMVLEVMWFRRFRSLDRAKLVFESIIFGVDFLQHLLMVVKVFKDLILPGK